SVNDVIQVPGGAAGRPRRALVASPTPDGGGRRRAVPLRRAAARGTGRGAYPGHRRGFVHSTSNSRRSGARGEHHARRPDR
ncbi:hypothetical protein KW485_21905, partial [Enterobacter kobei]|uniref:hypothetical protein n=1 Tax=Enterobacter kobei TaxID=208224 RepID=UPI002174E614